jgi:hypothetical protein
LWQQLKEVNTTEKEISERTKVVRFIEKSFSASPVVFLYCNTYLCIA